MYKKISIIGLGFVGLPMLVNLADKMKKTRIIGIEKKNNEGILKIKKLKNNNFYVKSNDHLLEKKFNKSLNKNIFLSNEIKDISKSDVILISTSFDFSKKNSLKNIKQLFTDIADNLDPGTLILTETTIPPGASRKILFPILRKRLIKRNIPISSVYFGYSFERIMPGINYLNSLNNNYRAYSGINKISSKKIRLFLQTFLNTKKYPLHEFDFIDECETCKIVENSFRAMNIAFTDEWMKFADLRKMNLNKILDAIRVRPTHQNIMRAGLGVGGYCLTKDSKFAGYSNKLFDKKKINFCLSDKSRAINNRMVNNSIKFIKERVKTLKNKKILFLGSTYKEDVDDIRNSPAKELINKISKYTNSIVIYDPFTNIDKIKLEKRYLKRFDIFIFCVSHAQIKKLNFKNIFNLKKVIFDLNHVIPKKILKKTKNYNKNIFVLGDYS